MSGRSQAVPVRRVWSGLSLDIRTMGHLDACAGSDRQAIVLGPLDLGVSGHDL